jgi:selenocysteine lyase/cysteine desulfurase
LDLERLRRETPGVQDHIHLNHAGASLLSTPVLSAMKRYLDDEARIGGYRQAVRTAEHREQIRADIARLIHAPPEGIAFTTSATDSWNTIFLTLAERLGPGARIIVDSALYGSHAITLLRTCERTGARLERVGDDPAGRLDLGALERALALPGVALACLTHMPTSSGLVNPMEDAAQRCSAAGVPLVVDACQSVGQWPVFVDRMPCVALTATGRKYLRGPRGTGFLYVDPAALPGLVPPTPDLRGAVWTGDGSYELVADARRFERWEQDLAAVHGLGVAVEQALDIGILAIRHRIEGLASRLRHQLAELPGVRVLDRGPELSGICTFTLRDRAPEAVKAALAAAGVVVSVSHHTSGRWDLGPKGVDAVVRASVHVLNTEDELDRAVAALAALIGRQGAAP